MESTTACADVDSAISLRHTLATCGSPLVFQPTTPHRKVVPCLHISNRRKDESTSSPVGGLFGVDTQLQPVLEGRFWACQFRIGETVTMLSRALAVVTPRRSHVGTQLVDARSCRLDIHRAPHGLQALRISPFVLEASRRRCTAGTPGEISRAEPSCIGRSCTAADDGRIAHAG